MDIMSVYWYIFIVKVTIIEGIKGIKIILTPSNYTLPLQTSLSYAPNFVSSFY